MSSISSLSRVTSAAASSAAADVVRHDDSRLSGGAVAAHASTHATGGSDPVTPAAINAAYRLTPTAVQTANYTAVNGDHVRVDATASALTVTLPTATSGAVIGVRKTDSSANAITVTDGGSLSNTLRLVDEGRTYVGVSSSWLPVNSLYSLTGFDGRYLRSTQNFADLNNVVTARANLGLGGAALLNVGAATGTVAAGDDTRLTNARTPTAHASTHASGGSDVLTPAAIGAAASAHTHAPAIVSLGSIAAAGSISIDASTGSLFRASAAGSTLTLAVPTNGSDGVQVNIEVLASVATSLAISGSIFPTTGISSPVSIPVNKRWFGGLRFVSGLGWFLLASTVQL